MKITLIALLFIAFPYISFAGSSSYERSETNSTTAADYNDKICPKGIRNAMDLISMNPYDSKDQCFKYAGPNVQLLSRTTAFFGFLNNGSPFALIDFGKESAPMNYFNGVVKGKIPHVYQTVSGMARTIHSFVVVPKSKEYVRFQEMLADERRRDAAIEAAATAERIKKAARDKELYEMEQTRKAKEDAEEKERQEQNKRRLAEVEASNNKLAAVERLQRNGFSISDGIINDKNSGLMWIADNRVISITSLNNAKNVASDLKYAGYNDWRVPSISDVKTLFANVEDIILATDLDFKDKCILTTSNTSRKGSLFHRDCISVFSGSVYSLDSYHGAGEGAMWLVRGGAVSSWVKGFFE